MYSPFLGKAISGAALLPTASATIVFQSVIFRSLPAHPRPDAGSHCLHFKSLGYCFHRQSDSSSSCTWHACAASPHCLSSWLPCRNFAISSSMCISAEWKSLDISSLKRHSQSSLSQSCFLGSYPSTLSTCLSHISSLLVSPGL